MCWRRRVQKPCRTVTRPVAAAYGKARGHGVVDLLDEMDCQEDGCPARGRRMRRGRRTVGPSRSASAWAGASSRFALVAAQQPAQLSGQRFPRGRRIAEGVDQQPGVIERNSEEFPEKPPLVFAVIAGCRGGTRHFGGCCRRSRSTRSTRRRPSPSRGGIRGSAGCSRR